MKKIRASKAEIEYYIHQLRIRGYKDVSKTKIGRIRTVTFTNDSESVTLSYSNNGWLIIT